MDLTNASEVRFYQWGPGGNLLINDAAQVSVTDAATGAVEYDYSRDQVIRQGANAAEWRVKYSDGDVQWFPQDGNLEILVAGPGGDREMPAADLDEQDVTVGVLDADRVEVQREVLGGVVAHRTHIPADLSLTVPADYGAVIAGPLTGEGEITGEGRLKVI